MAEPPDFAHLPRGQLEWTALIAALSETDDRAERHFLEIKSEVDLNQESGRAKVAKFILGAANRPPDVARRYFDGSAVMLLGIAPGAVTGIRPFEAMDLARTVAKYIGVEGPGWDFERIRVDADHDVIAIIVDPPEGDVWTCLRDGHEGLRDGAIYIRADGETRQAKGDEVRALINRSRKPKVTPEFDVSVAGAVVRYVAAQEVLDEYIEATRERLLDTHRQAMRKEFSSRALNALLGGNFSEARSYEGYRKSIERWAEEVRRSWGRIVDYAVATTGRETSIGVRNLSPAFVENLEVSVHVRGAVKAIEWKDPRDFNVSSHIPEPPLEWGPLGPLARPTWPAIANFPPDRHRPSINIVSLEDDDRASVTVRLDSLRPKGMHRSEYGEFVLATRDVALGEVSGTWRITARGHHRVYEGELTIPVIDCDLAPWIWALLNQAV